MAFTIPNNDAVFHVNQSRVFSTDINAIAQGLGGDGVLSGGDVSAQGTPDMTLAVAAGVDVIAGVLVTVASGNVTVTAADGTNPRIDLVVVDNAGTKSVTAGTPAASPEPPAVPANSVLHAMVYVPAAVASIATNKITDKRVVVPPLATSTVRGYVPAGVGTALVLLESRTAAASASLNFTTRNAVGQSGATFQSDYDEYMIDLVGLLPANNAVACYLLGSTDGGATWLGGTNYKYTGRYNGSNGDANVWNNHTGTSQFDLSIGANLGNAGTKPLCTRGRLFTPLSAALHKTFIYESALEVVGNTQFYLLSVAGTILTTTAINAVQVKMSAGNIASGTVRIYGLVKL